MKNINITSSVMDKVVRYEQSHTSRWLTAFFVSLGLVLIGIGYLVWNMYTTATQMHTGDLISLFVEDKEIVAEFWQDTLTVIFEEIPPVTFIVVGALLLGCIVLIIRTQKKRKVIARVRSELAKRKKSSNNTSYGKE